MVRTPLDGKPEPITVPCMLCNEPFIAKYHWLFSRWIRSTSHEKCADAYDRQKVGANQPVERPIPPRYRDFDATRANAEALQAAESFSHRSDLKTLAIGGVAARGKSRLMWAIIQTFFDELEVDTGLRRWVDYYLFTDLITEQDKSVLAKVKMGRYVFIDDIGCTDSYGRERAQLQDVIRTRVQKEQWTFLTIDSPDFDPGLKDFFRDRALDIWIDQ